MLHEYTISSYSRLNTSIDTTEMDFKKKKKKSKKASKKKKKKKSEKIKKERIKFTKKKKSKLKSKQSLTMKILRMILDFIRPSQAIIDSICTNMANACMTRAFAR